MSLCDNCIHNRVCLHTENITTCADMMPKREWIPVKEKLPNDPEEYIVTVNMGDVNCVGMDYYSVMCGCFEGYGKDVIAWMLLPKPFEPQESEDKE